MSFTASDRPMPSVESERQVEKGEGVAQCSPEKLSSPAADLTADGEDLGGFFEVGVERGHGVAGEVDQFGVAEHVAQHRPGALVVGVELVDKVVAVIVMLVGVGFVAVLTDAIAQRFITPAEERAEDERADLHSELDALAARLERIESALDRRL